jgi:predicted DNA-binding protein
VVSLRISDQEKRELEKISKSSAKKISEIAREAIEFWIAKRKRLCLDV